jgi:hypothetical protein
MSRLFIGTRGICSWRERLASPDRQWKRGFSAFETAVSWEQASRSSSGIPAPLENLLRESKYLDPVLLFAVAEHKVDLPGGTAASQSDVWAVINTAAGMVSMTVEAKARESFGDEILERWLIAGKTQASIDNRKERWDHVRSFLPESDTFLQVRYQMLHRCAASVIEARRLGYQHAAFVVQAFNTPEKSFQDFVVFCRALKIPAARGSLATTSVGGISLSVGWADCPAATDEAVAACA